MVGMTFESVRHVPVNQQVSLKEPCWASVLRLSFHWWRCWPCLAMMSFLFKNSRSFRSNCQCVQSFCCVVFFFLSFPCWAFDLLFKFISGFCSVELSAELLECAHIYLALVLEMLDSCLDTCIFCTSLTRSKCNDVRYAAPVLHCPCLACGVSTSWCKTLNLKKQLSSDLHIFLNCLDNHHHHHHHLHSLHFIGYILTVAKEAWQRTRFFFVIFTERLWFFVFFCLPIWCLNGPPVLNQLI